MTRILVTSASGANGDGYGTLLGFTADGHLAGPFSDDRRITDPRGLSLSPAGDLVYVTSGDDRVVALDQNGTVTWTPAARTALTLAAGSSRPTAATVSRSDAAGRSWPCRLASTRRASLSYRITSFRSHGASASAPAVNCTFLQGSVPPAKATTRSPYSTTAANCSRRSW